MTYWAVFVAFVMGAAAYAGDVSSTLVSMAEILGVVALFTLICAAEVFSIPKSKAFDDNHIQPES